MYIKFLKSKDVYECNVIPNQNIVTLKFTDNVVENTNGFNAYKDKECNYLIGKYTEYKTVYRNDEETISKNEIQLSNDGSVYVKPIPTITFMSNGGGILDGETVQQVSNYENLIIPIPISNENYEFKGWMPEIPLSGEVLEDETFTAFFESLLPPEPTLEERVTNVEEQSDMLSMTVDGILTDVIPSLM